MPESAPVKLDGLKLVPSSRGKFRLPGREFYQISMEDLVPGYYVADLVRDPENPYDPNAVKVVIAGTHQIGFMPRASAEKLAPALDASEETIKVAIEIVGPAKSRKWYAAWYHGMYRPVETTA